VKELHDQETETGLELHHGGGGAIIIKPRYVGLNWVYVTMRLKAVCPGIRIQAYLGQVEAKGGGTLDLSSTEVRDSIVKTAEAFLDLNFDGIHYDIEPIYSGDEDYLSLLEATHTMTRERGALLSVAVAKPEPIAGMAALAEMVANNPGYWTGPTS